MIFITKIVVRHMFYAYKREDNQYMDPNLDDSLFFFIFIKIVIESPKI